METSATPSNGNEIEDTEMGDDSGPPSDDEGEEGSDDEEGDGQGEGDDEEADQTDSGLERLQTNETNESNDTNESLDLAEDNDNRGRRERDISSSPDLPLARMASGTGHDHGSAGSPLKNVVTFASTYDERSPDIHSDGEAEAEGDLDEPNHDDIHATLHSGIEHDGVQGGYHTHQQMNIEMPPEHQDPYGIAISTDRDDANVMSMQHDEDYDEDDEMLLDGDDSGMEHMDFSAMTSQDQHFPHHQSLLGDESVHMSMAMSDHNQQGNMADFDPHTQGDTHSRTLESMLEAPPGGIEYQNMEERAHEQGQEQEQEQREKDQEDTFEDLLGSLEDHLDAHDQAPISHPEPTPQSETPAQEQAEPEMEALPAEPEEAEIADDEEEVSSIPVSAPIAVEANLPPAPAEVSPPAAVEQEEVVPEAPIETEVVLGLDFPATEMELPPQIPTEVEMGPEAEAEVVVEVEVEVEAEADGDEKAEED